MIGLVFAESRRQVSIEAAARIHEQLRSLDEIPELVGVFVNETPARMREIARLAHLDVIQLSGDESPAEVLECAQHYPVIKAVRFPTSSTLEQALEICDSYISLGLGERLRLLVDAYHPLAYGGTGQTGDWDLAAQLAVHHDLILAGGLTPENVAHAVETVCPMGLDVSSGVEIRGMKDPALIAAFVRATRSHSDLAAQH